MQGSVLRMARTVLLAVAFSQAAGWGVAQERPRLRISTLFIGSSLLPFWIAKDQGYFSRAGVDVELIWMQSNLSTSALLAGEVDAIFGTPQVPLQVMSTKGTPNFVAIAAWASSSEHWMVVNPAIKSIKDLDGKVLATSRPKSADHGYALTMLERNGVDTRRVTFLSTGGQAGRVAAIESGRVMGSVVNRYYALLLRRKGFKSIERLERADYPFPPSTFVAARESLQTKRTALRSFFMGLIEGTKRLKSDKELSLKLIRKHMRLDNQEIVETAYDDGLTVSYPYFTERQFQVAVDLLSKSLGQPVELSYARVVDHSIVDEIARSGGL